MRKTFLTLSFITAVLSLLKACGVFNIHWMLVLAPLLVPSMMFIGAVFILTIWHIHRSRKSQYGIIKKAQKKPNFDIPDIF